MTERSKVEQEAWQLIDQLQKQYTLDSIFAEVHRLCGIPGGVIRGSQTRFTRLNENSWKLIRQSLWQIQDFPELQIKLVKAGNGKDQQQAVVPSEQKFIPVHPPVSPSVVQTAAGAREPDSQPKPAGDTVRHRRKAKPKTIQPHPEEYERLYAHLRERKLIN